MSALYKKEIYMVLSYFFIGGLVKPCFTQFSYYFMLNEAHITKFQFAMFGVLSRACNIVGTVIYKNHFRQTETRTVIFYSTIISVISAFGHLVFALRWNLQMGIPDLIFIIFTDVVLGCFLLAFCVLPCMALFAKITPPGIEGTIFAFLTGIWHFSDCVVSPLIGNLINQKLAHVTASDLSNYPQLMLIAFLSSFFGFFTLWLIPLEGDIGRYRRERGERVVVVVDEKGR